MEYITRKFELLEEALEEQGQSEQRSLRIFMGGILATLAQPCCARFVQVHCGMKNVHLFKKKKNELISQMKRHVTKRHIT